MSGATSASSLAGKLGAVMGIGGPRKHAAAIPAVLQAAVAPGGDPARQKAASSSGGRGPGTLLTGPVGVDPGSLILGKNKLLGL